jgi:hypothetical protein
MWRIKITVFCNMMLCSLVDVGGGGHRLLDASIFRALRGKDCCKHADKLSGAIRDVEFRDKPRLTSCTSSLKAQW